ncbi:MAG TPA: hypothetical protein ENI35_06905 [Candidatus Desulfofervidus auxilii]|uniref:Uncharacterized protein n=1 Tax=Desulfofervidus auxilii TaxID=1621989 RepID=A0A7C2A505_DESA2|nr:hypothetical protein [Candidatus Desulfofervidus auxilii]
MNQRIHLPKEYKPFDHLILCSNILINVQIPFEVDGNVPLLIGRNELPQIWLNAPSQKPRLEWIPIVRQNRSLHNEVKIIKDENELIVKINTIEVLRVLKNSANSANVVQLDLRPIGLNIYGDESHLVVGTNQLVSNTFQNAYVMIGIGNK